MAEQTLKPGWTRVAFGDVVRQVKDRVDPETSGLERYIAGEHMDTDDLRIRRWGTIDDGYLGPAFHMRFKPGQVLYGSRRTYLRKVAVPDFEGICANTTFVLESKGPSVLLPELLPFVMQTDAFHDHSTKQSKGSVNPYVNFSDLAWYKFALPPLEEQRRIASLLEASQRLVESSRSLVETLDSLVVSYVKQHLETHLATFSSCTVSMLADRLTVGIVVRPAEWYVPDSSGIPALRSLNVLPGRLEMSDLVRISDEGHSLHRKSHLKAGDVVIVRTGRPGDAVVIPEDIGPLNCVDLIVVTPNSSILPEYLVYYLNSPIGRQKSVAGSAGTAQQHLNIKEFRNLEIPCPPIDIQSSFVGDLRLINSDFVAAGSRFDQCSKNHHLFVNRSLGD